MSSNKRAAARYSRQLPAYLDHVELLTTNVSLAGLQLECPALRIRRIRPQLDSGRIRLEIQYDDDRRVHADCAVSYVSPYGDEYLIGVSIERLEGNGGQLWAAYIGTLTNPLPE